MKSFSLQTKLFITLGLIAASALFVFAWQAWGETTVGITLDRSGTDLERGLVGHWTFDGPDMLQNVSDSSGQGNDGNLTGQTSTTTASGTIGQALEFDGVDDTAEISNESNFDFERTDSFSLSTWVNPDAVLTDGAEDAIISKLRSTSPFSGWAFQLTSRSGQTENRIRLLLINDWVGGDRLFATTNYSVPADTWTHVVITYDGSSSVSGITIYADGVERSKDATAQDDSLSSSILNDVEPTIASREDAAIYFDGQIDDARIYDRALSADEVKRLYQLGATTKIAKTIERGNQGIESGLVGHWTFDGPDMLQNVSDSSGQGNDGNLTGQTSTTTASGTIGQALEFDGVDDSVDTTYNPVFGTEDDFSVGLWFKVDNLSDSNDKNLMMARDENDLVILEIDGNASTCVQNELHAAVGDTSGNLDILCFDWAQDQNWHHYMVTYDVDGEVVGYVDGTRVDGTGVTSTGVKDLSAVSFHIGSTNTITELFPGAIDDARIYDRALSAKEIERLYQMGR